MGTGCGSRPGGHKTRSSGSFSRAAHRSSRVLHSEANYGIGPRPAVRPEGSPMKTLTEFSGTLVRMAAKAVAEARKKLPKEAFALRVPPPEPDTKPDVEPHDNHNEPAPEEGIDSATDAADEELAKDAVSHIPASALPKPPDFKPGEAETPSDRETHEDPDTQFRREEQVAGQDLSGQAQDGPPAEDPEAEIKPPPRVDP